MKAKSIICRYIYKIHRHVYDHQYRQNYKITYKDRPILLWYSFLFLLIPNFRDYLNKNYESTTRQDRI